MDLSDVSVRIERVDSADEDLHQKSVVALHGTIMALALSPNSCWNWSFITLPARSRHQKTSAKGEGEKEPLQK